jgi:UDP-N-acetylmuramate dehydrogenase
MWFRVGGPAQVLFRPQDSEDLCHFILNKPPEMQVTPIGVGSNLLVRDGGILGVVIRLGRGFADVQVSNDQVICGAGALDRTVAMVCQQHSLSGLEFLYGIPGTIGGAVRMNAGAYGREVKDVLLWAEVVDHQGQLHQLSLAEIGLTYRKSGIPPEWIIVRAAFQAEPGNPEHIAERMKHIQETREASQPVNARTGGSTFANPENKRAWELIDAAGCRGMRIGGAQVSEKHCNFLINTGTATAHDLESLGEAVRQKVLEHSGVDLRWEIHRVGVFNNKRI